MEIKFEFAVKEKVLKVLLSPTNILMYVIIGLSIFR